MAQDKNPTTGLHDAVAKGRQQDAGGVSARKHKVYDHVMTEPEKFALQTVQRAQSALRTINDAIKSGKTVNPAIIDQCFELSKAAGKMLFPTA